MEFLRRRLGLILRALVSVLLILWLVRSNHINWGKVWAGVQDMDGHWLVLSFCCFMPVTLIVSWRWRMLLGVHGVRLGFWRVFELNMIGQFFSAFLLGTTGGDVFKIFYAARAVPQRKAAVAFTVVVDRVIGMIALLLVGVLLSISQLRLLLSTPGTRAATGTFYLLALGGLAASVLATAGPSLLRHPAIRAFIKRLPFVHRGSSLLAAYEDSARAYGINLLALLGSVPSHISILTMGYCLLHAMHLAHPASLLAFCSILAMVNMLIALPISISGIGVREGLFIIFFNLLGIDHDHAVTFSLTFFAINLLWSLLAGPFYFLYRHETHTPAPDLHEVEPIFSKP